MTHYWTKQCPECLGAGETDYQVDEMRGGDEWHGREICTCQQCDGEGEIKQEMDDLSEEQMELMDLGFERDETTHTRFELFIGDCEIRVDFNKDASKVSQFRLNDVSLDMYIPELIERVKLLYFGITGEELITKN
jgi:DnaJ-class molecular chaperone